MKKLFLISFLVPFLGFGQIKSDSEFIKAIDRKLQNSKTIKLENLGENWNGSFENMTIYTQNNIPILIVCEENKVINAEHTDLATSTSTTNIVGKFYIVNWNKNKYIRIGKIKNIYNFYSEKTSEKKSEEIMKSDYIFEYDREKVNNLLIKNKIN